MYNRYSARSTPEPVEELTHTPHAPQAPSSGGILEKLRALLDGLKGEGSSLFSGIPLLEKLDSSDILLILVLFFLYRESEDEEWLIILALVLLMGL